MCRALLIVLVCAACGPKFPESINRHGGDTADQVCNEETFSPRGTAGLRCRSRRQIENDQRFSKDLDPDSRPRQSFNN